MRRTDDLSRLTNLTVHGKKHLVQLGVRTLPQLQTFLTRADADDLLASCASLAGERHYLEGRLAAFASGKAVAHGSAAELPKGENVAVFLTLQREPLGRMTYLAGLLVHVRPDLAAVFSPSLRSQLFDVNGKARPHVLVAQGPAEVLPLRRRFIRLLHSVLLDVHRYNADREWQDQLSLQVYAHTDRDQEQLTAWLLEGLNEPELSGPAMDLLLHFHGPDLMLTDEHPDQPVPWPVVVLQNVLTKLLALPVEVSYTLPESLYALESPFRYDRSDELHYPLGHGLRSKAIHAAWHLGRTEELDELRREAGRYLFALRALLWAVRPRVEDHLFLWPARFQLPARVPINEPILSRLAFFTRYESVVQCLGLRQQRLEPRVVQARLGLMVELEARSATEFDVLGEPAVEMDAAGFPSWLLVRDPLSAARARPLPAPIEASAAAGEGRLGLTDSQIAAYREIRRRRVVAVWGPPGTGKTHFLAAVILALADACAARGKVFRVLITAFTHAAIENVLRKIDELKRSLALGATVQVGKAKGWQGEHAQVGEVVAEDRLAAWLGRRPQAAVGATVYSCIKAGKKADLPAFDLVVVDEASQVRVGEAAVPVSLVGPEGRLVLAGDDLQLPPIVQGAYPDVEPGEPLLHRSIFEAVRSRVAVGSPVVKMLQENRRMNDVLTSFAAAFLYGQGYRCFDAAVAERRLRLRALASLSEFCRACLDPDYPLVVVVLEGVQAAGENPLEARLVADLVVALRDGLLDSEGQPYGEDARFFKDGLFIVSPHRAQIRAIRRELNSRRKWTSAPFVDTVDKMQGQEADTVLISYGVADPEYALREAEFIYSVNRLNVSITRARAKSIVCLPRPLLEGLPRVLESDDAARGLAFMQNIALEADRQTPALLFPLAEGIQARVLRARRPVAL
jgi:hypothetical protein